MTRPSVPAILDDATTYEKSIEAELARSFLVFPETALDCQELALRSYLHEAGNFLIYIERVFRVWERQSAFR
jgi:hypothetical protein